MPVHEPQQLADYCRSHLSLHNTQAAEEYGYSSLPLCVIDAVFSIGVRYVSTENTVKRFVAHFDAPPDLSIREFIKLHHQKPTEPECIEFMAREVYKNSQRTSTKNGILKAEAVLRAAEVLLKHHVDYLPEMKTVFKNAQFEADFKKIPGQTSGISLSYLYMLTGAETEIKPDRMVIRFIEAALGRPVSVQECHPIIVETCELLKEDFPHLTPRSLDHIIWEYQRSQ